jgi:hypothetical protein
LTFAKLDEDPELKSTREHLEALEVATLERMGDVLFQIELEITGKFLIYFQRQREFFMQVRF